jgi:hypothetical protein
MMITSLNPALTASTNANTPLLNFLNPNNPATTSVNNGQTFAQPTASNQFGIVPPQAFPTMNPQSFSMPANGNMFAQQQGQIPLTGTPNYQFANQTPTATAPTGSDTLGLNVLTGLEQQANEFLTFAKTQASPTAGTVTTGTTGIAATPLPRQVEPNITVMLPEGFKVSDLNSTNTEKTEGSTEESSEETLEIKELRKSLKGLEDQEGYLQGTNALNRSPEMNKKIQEFQNKVDALRTKIANLESNQPNNPQTALESKIDELTKKMDDLKKNNPKETASVPKKKPTVPTTVAKAPAPKTPAKPTTKTT